MKNHPEAPEANAANKETLDRSECWPDYEKYKVRHQNDSEVHYNVATYRVIEDITIYLLDVIGFLMTFNVAT